MDGVNGGTSFPDANVGGSAHVWTPAPGATTSILNPKFAPAFCTLTSSAFLSTPDHADFTLGSGPFTVDFWIRSASAASKNVCGQVNSSLSVSSASTVFDTDSSSRIGFSACVGSTMYTVRSTTAINSSTVWTHLAGVRTGNILRLFVNGVQEGGDVAITGTVNDSSNLWSIGRAGESVSNIFFGDFDEFRLSVGVARWTSNFTPPTEPYS